MVKFIGLEVEILPDKKSERFLAKPVPEWAIRLGTAAWGFAFALNLLALILYTFVKFSVFDIVIHLVLTVVSSALLFTLISNKTRLVYPGMLLMITTAVALIYRSFPEPSQDAAAIFGISAFIWLLFEKVVKS